MSPVQKQLDPAIRQAPVYSGGSRYRIYSSSFHYCCVCCKQPFQGGPIQQKPNPIWTVDAPLPGRDIVEAIFEKRKGQVAALDSGLECGHCCGAAPRVSLCLQQAMQSLHWTVRPWAYTQHRQWNVSGTFSRPKISLMSIRLLE